MRGKLARIWTCSSVTCFILLMDDFVVVRVLVNLDRALPGQLLDDLLLHASDGHADVRLVGANRFVEVLHVVDVHDLLIHTDCHL